MSYRRPVDLLRLFLVFTAIGVFFALHSYLNDVTWHRTGTLPTRFLEEMSGAYGAMVLVPAMAWLARRVPFRRGRVLQAIGINLVALVVYTLLHTTINSILRYGFAPLLGIHGYSYGPLIYRYPMEAAGDTVYYALLMTSLYLLDHFIASRQLEAKLADAKLENLRLQLHPHFLFNTLNAISSVMYEDVEKADAMISKLSDFLRTVLDSGNVHVVTLDEELAIERMYVDIMTTRLERNLHLSVDVAEDARDSRVPFMLLQPLIENSIRHGMGSARSTLDVDVAVARANGCTVIRVDDDGLGIAPAAVRGVGLSNVASRLQYMYGDAAAFTIGPRPQGSGTRAILTIPFREGGSGCR